MAQPNPGQQSHCQGTWGDLLLHVPAIAGVSVLFSWRGKRGGTPSQHGLPMSSVPLFPLPPPFISVGIGSFFLCPELCPPQTQTRLQVRAKPAARRRGGFGDADVQQEVEKVVDNRGRGEVVFVPCWRMFCFMKRIWGRS